MNCCYRLARVAAGLWLAGAGRLPALDYFVAQGGQEPAWPYTNGWTAAASNLQEAVDAAAEGDTVWIRPGRYVAPESPTNYAGADNVVFLNKLLHLRATNDVPGRVVIDGEDAHRGIAVVRTVASTASLLLEGLIVSNCTVSAPVGASALGGGIYIEPPYRGPTKWNAHLQDCVITHNRAFVQSTTNIARGGGLHADTLTSPWILTLSNCVFRSNEATNIVGNQTVEGGGAWVRSAESLLFSGCVFDKNRSSDRGGAVFATIYGSILNKRFEHCIFRDNWTDIYVSAMSGGGAAMGGGHYRNCLFVGNAAKGAAPRGGAINVDRDGTLVVESCTIISNTATYGGGIGIRLNSADDLLIMTNSIVYYNGPNDDLYLGTNKNQVSYSCFEKAGSSVFEGTNNITAAPGFVDWTARDYRLRASSPCVNAGVNLDWMVGALDLEGNRRINWNRVDLGAYEHQVRGAALIVR